MEKKRKIEEECRTYCNFEEHTCISSKRKINNEKKKNKTKISKHFWTSMGKKKQTNSSYQYGMEDQLFVFIELYERTANKTKKKKNNERIVQKKKTMWVDLLPFVRLTLNYKLNDFAFNFMHFSSFTIW